MNVKSLRLDDTGGAVDLIHSLVVYLHFIEILIGNVMHWLNYGFVERIAERVLEVGSVYSKFSLTKMKVELKV